MCAVYYVCAFQSHEITCVRFKVMKQRFKVMKHKQVHDFRHTPPVSLSTYAKALI